MSYDPNDATVEEAIDYVRSTITPLDIVEMTEDIMVFNGKIFSPFNPDERTPSCHLYEDGWFDFSTGKGGDVIDLYRALTGATFGKALHALQQGAFRIDADPDRVRRHEPLVPDLTHMWNRYLPPVVWADRRNDLVILKPLGVSVDYLKTRVRIVPVYAAFAAPDTIAVPHWHDGAVRGIKLRKFGSKSAVPGSSFACGLYWPTLEPAPSTTLIITEGESDAWALDAHFDGTVTVASLPSGAGLWKNQWLEPLERYTKIYTAFDNDRAGQQATEKVRAAIGWERWRELKVPDMHKDVREAMAAGWEPTVTL